MTVVLDLLYVDAPFQRRGIGAALVEWGCRVADTNGWVAFVEASPLGKKLYESKDFRTVEKVDLHWDEWADKETATYYFMVREPKKSVPAVAV